MKDGYRRWRQLWATKLESNHRLREPIFFHHVAKTGGTSLIQAIRSVTPAKWCLTERGNISAKYVNALVTQGLTQGQFIYGHPRTGAVLPVRGRARIITLIREPCEQLISNYFWLRRDWRVPHFKAARRLGFREFLIAHPYYAIFQTASLWVAIEDRPIARLEDLIDHLPAVFKYLDEMYAVATPSLAAQLFGKITNGMGIPDPGKFPHRNKTRLSDTRREILREQFAELQSHPDLAPLFAAEHAIYERARSVANRDFGKGI